MKKSNAHAERPEKNPTGHAQYLSKQKSSKEFKRVDLLLTPDDKHATRPPLHAISAL
jgi:hypothetical protein